MPVGYIFWTLMILWFVFGLWWNWPTGDSKPWGLAGHFLIFFLFLLVGWKLFGPPLQ